MAQKIIKIGSSVGITIPKDILERVRISAGDIVQVEVSNDSRRITIEPLRTSVPIVDPKLIAWTDSFIETNRTLLERLSKK